MATLAVIRCSLRSLAARSRVDCNFRGAALYSTPSSLNSAPPTEAVTRGNRASPRAKQRREPVPPRTEKMEVDQNWCNVYPTASAFKPSVVPLPIRMGYPIERGVPPDKIGNLELIKISNFLHLTPPAIKRHCTALKEFCTEWPAALDSDEKCEQHFPIKIETTDYVAAGPSLRNPKARMVTLTIRLSNLNLDDHARKKFIKLVGNRYNKDTDILTIMTDRCPLRRQNYDYAMYLLTVLYHESWKTEVWELDKTEADLDEFIWENSQSEKNALDTIFRMKEAEKLSVSKEEIINSPEVHNYKTSVVNIKNIGETEDNILQYKESVKKLLHLQVAA
ncbi:28S ribosomal protein S35, mitochondrial isoform X1 [Carcharodon carcharias]|uniref:28S ribosomal protein S35, mitochondrial isoform X1 n=1 Tax=Carcharodon carcharias TaxID=13397 RepID=UPI001B7F3ED7|nr:28S ribosomal protein S35, mitochondrial isoform X1 [Carcharodon carcharias]